MRWGAEKFCQPHREREKSRVGLTLAKTLRTYQSGHVRSRLNWFRPQQNRQKAKCVDESMITHQQLLSRSCRKQLKHRMHLQWRRWGRIDKSGRAAAAHMKINDTEKKRMWCCRCIIYICFTSLVSGSIYKE